MIAPLFNKKKTQCEFVIVNIASQIYITINIHLCAFNINNTIVPNIGMMALVGMPFGMHLALNIFINSMVMVYIYVEMCPILTMIHTPFEMHMTLVMTYIPIKTCLTPTMAYATFQTCVIMAMVYISIGTHLTLIMFYIPIKTYLTFYVHGGTLAMT